MLAGQLIVGGAACVSVEVQVVVQLLASLTVTVWAPAQSPVKDPDAPNAPPSMEKV
jgi:hypothetical protein